jgi:hypothetical protein
MPVSETIALSLTGECPDVTSVNIALNSGWNLISLPLIPNNSAIATVLSGVSSHVVSVWNYSGGMWRSWDPIGGGDLTTIVDGKGYWINMNAAATLTESGKVNPLPPTTPPTYSVATGWNLMGFKSTCAMKAGDYLGNVPWVRIWGFNSTYSAVQAGDWLQPGLGYWIAATSAGTIFP